MPTPCRHTSVVYPPSGEYKPLTPPPDGYGSGLLLR